MNSLDVPAVLDLVDARRAFPQFRWQRRCRSGIGRFAAGATTGRLSDEGRAGERAAPAGQRWYCRRLAPPVQCHSSGQRAREGCQLVTQSHDTKFPRSQEQRASITWQRATRRELHFLWLRFFHRPQPLHTAVMRAPLRRVVGGADGLLEGAGLRRVVDGGHSHAHATSAHNNVYGGQSRENRSAWDCDGARDDHLPLTQPRSSATWSCDWRWRCWRLGHWWRHRWHWRRRLRWQRRRRRRGHERRQRWRWRHRGRLWWRRHRWH